MTNMRERIARAIMISRNGQCLVRDWETEARDNPNVEQALKDADAAMSAYNPIEYELLYGTPGRPRGGLL